MQAGLGGRARRFHPKFSEHKTVARLHAKRAERTVVMQHHQGALGALGGDALRFCDLGVEGGNPLLRQTNAWKTGRVVFVDADAWYVMAASPSSIKQVIADVIQGYQP